MTQADLSRPLDPFGVLSSRFRALREAAPAGERRFLLPLATFDRAAAAIAADGGRLITLFLSELPERSLVCAFAARGQLVSLRAPLGAGARAYAALTPAIRAADLMERELRDRHGLDPLGHPAAARVLLPDADAFQRLLEGDDETFVIPYGPIRSGVFEAIQFVVETGGEDVLALQARLFFKQRGLERRFQGLSTQAGALLAGRVAGVSAVAHALAYAEAVERALGLAPPPAAALWRAVHAELERIANHLDVAARLAEDAALAVGSARFAILKEEVMRLRARLSGSRFGRDAIVPGGVREPGLDPEELLRTLAALERDLLRDRRLLLGTTGLVDRLVNAGRLDVETVDALGGVGPVARAAGASVDARFERPYAAYERLGFSVVTRGEGDAMARLQVRLGEIDVALHVIRQALDRRSRLAGALAVEPPAGSGSGFGWSEAAQGELVYRVDVEDGRLRQVAIASPSLRNWPLFVASFRGDVLTDFSFIEHSFGLTEAGADR